MISSARNSLHGPLGENMADIAISFGPRPLLEFFTVSELNKVSLNIGEKSTGEEIWGLETDGR